MNKQVMTKEVDYKSWWNQFRCPWLQSDKMTEEEIRIKADDAWDYGDYKEMINLMAELICRLEDEIKTRVDDAWECGNYKEVVNLMADLICRLEQED